MDGRPLTNGLSSTFQEIERAGLLQDAAGLSRWLLVNALSHPYIDFHLGCVCLSRHLYQSAEVAFRSAVTLHPMLDGAWNNLSITLNEQGSSSDAERCARRAIEINPTSPLYWISLGNSLFRQCRWSEAVSAFRMAIGQEEKCASAWSNLGAAEHRLGNLGAAQDAYERCLDLTPMDAGALTNSAYLHTDRGRPRKSLELISTVLENHQRLAPAWVAKGNALKALRELSEAGLAYRQAILIAPNHREAHLNLALVLRQMHKLTEAESVIRGWLTEHPDDPKALALLGEIILVAGPSESALDLVRRSIQLEPSPDVHSTFLLQSQYADQVSPQSLLAAHKEWSEAYSALQISAPSSGLREPRVTGRPLRLGFVSPDFGSHPVAFCILPVLQNLDKAKCLVACYSDGLLQDQDTERFRIVSDLWRQTAGMTHDELVAQIRRDAIDILIDLAGHTGKRMMTFAKRAAGIQMSWFGYAGTTGLREMDYLIADRFHVRTDEDRFFSEQILRMPHGYVCYQPPSNAPIVQLLPGLRQKHVTFGCFNNPAKFSRRIIEAWGQILNRVHGSRLFLKFHGLDDDLTRRRILEILSACNVEEARIGLEGRSPRQQLLEAYGRVDIALDTQPYSGGVTTCEALWMGVPVVTFPGSTLAGRHATSHLTNAGYPQFVANDLQCYVELAVNWANRLDELSVIRSQMRDQMRHSALCDAPRFSHDFLALLTQAWETCAAGK